MKEHKNVRDFLSFMTGDQQLLASSAGIVRNVSVTDLGGMPQTGKYKTHFCDSSRGLRALPMSQVDFSLCQTFMGTK